MTSYHDTPLLKPPVWTWEIPLYFFVGGAGGAAAVLAAAARAGGAEDSVVRDARWIAAAGATLSAPLLISDLGRPERFLNMLRVFKPQSPMSVGAWTLAAFGGLSAAAAVAGARPSRATLPVRLAADVAGLGSASAGLVMATYTGVLVGVSAIPVWKTHVRLLPVHFGASSLGAASSILELRGHRHFALNALALGAAVFETAAAVALETGDDRASRPLRAGRSGMMTRVASALSGPVPLALRLLGARRGAAASAILGSVLTRFAWVEAGKASANDVQAAL